MDDATPFYCIGLEPRSSLAIFLINAAQWNGFEVPGWSDWIEDDDAVRMGHFSWKSERYLLRRQEALV